MRVREAVAADASEWLRMRAILWPAETHAAEIDDFFRAGSTQLAALLVAERQPGGLAGFIEIGLRPYAEGCESSPVPFIEGWYVDEDVRRTGVGRDLIRAAEEWARGRGYSEIGSDVELENELSQAAHRALGYEEVGRLVCYRRSL